MKFAIQIDIGIHLYPRKAIAFLTKKVPVRWLELELLIKVLTVLINDDGGDEREQLVPYRVEDLPLLQILQAKLQFEDLPTLLPSA